MQGTYDKVWIEYDYYFVDKSTVLKNDLWADEMLLLEGEKGIW